MVTQKQRILIVDDEAAIRKLLSQKLSKEGYDCEEADDAVHVLKKLGSKTTELVILDLRMPGKSGIYLLPEIKAEYPDIAVIVVTAVAETSVAIQCMKLGADDYICKPFDLGDIALSVERTLKKRRLQREIKERYQSLEEQAGGQSQEIRGLFLGAIKALIFSLEAKDKYIAGHSCRVTEIALAIGRELALPEDDMEDLQWGSLLHDVGKIAVDQLILNKPARLTPGEYEHIMVHAQVGAGIVKPVVNEKVVAIIEHHHDRYDGSGLHQIVAGTEIPTGARILAVADAFDAMTSDRPYRKAMYDDAAYAELERCKGTQFDPRAVEVFLKIGKPVVDDLFARL